MRETHGARSPVRPEGYGEHPKQDSDGEFGRLPQRSRAANHQLLADHHDAAGFLHFQKQGGVVQVAEARVVLERTPQGGRIAQEQADRAEVRQPSRLGQTQPESLIAAALRRQFEQCAHRFG